MRDTKPTPEDTRKAPRGKPRRTLPGSPTQLMKHVWYALRKAGDLLDDPNTPPELLLRAVHAISGAANSWSKAHEQHQLRAEIQDLRERVETIQDERGTRR